MEIKDKDILNFLDINFLEFKEPTELGNNFPFKDSIINRNAESLVAKLNLTALKPVTLVKRKEFGNTNM